MKPCSRLSLLTLALLTATSTAFASGNYHHRDYAYHRDYKGDDYKGEIVRKPCCRPIKFLRDGIYVGAALGYDSFRTRQSVSEIDILGNADNANPPISTRGVNGSLFAGYGQYYRWFYIAGEILARYSGADTTYSINAYNSTLSVHSTFGVDILPGVKLNDSSLLYARVGYSRTDFKLSESGVVGGGASESNWGNGVDLGLGLETAMWREWSLRGEYVYTYYGSLNSQLGTRYSPSNSEFNLGVIYHFPCF